MQACKYYKTYEENCYFLCCRMLNVSAEHSISSAAFEISITDICDIQQNKLLHSG
jgi:hypothetical protein